MSFKSSIPLDRIRYNEKGLVPAIAQDYLDGTVLMMAWMNRESLQKTLETGETWYWSRSRQELWHKGATSGHIQKVRSLRYDCDSDTLLITVEQIGDVACHTGERSCFHQVDSSENTASPIADGASRTARSNEETSLLASSPIRPTKAAPPADTLSEIYRVISDRAANPSPESYTCKLLEGGDNKILKKIGEESAEVVMACKDDEKGAIASEVADLFYHVLVALAYHQVDIRDVYRQLQSRRK
ncbi:bifunctional phosphoribosyl-AMP cyclohydrolase/phosphoribosyl-ATP diphosphatase HisIE [Myxosarcina sp. GI1]|uniref:bifunctional phosphoribosyl-AMP cyclohydrolase/phosphoribosyl-ATP diphosphatase HisIE n=1 Tax=Myxosarcina sp. GI1 TaxID=1541065 RepID=UPI0005673BD6|nr:bifunctional phosphoribosyl-AMP cyclohydrolase/phosphoribosyl-ATP diphosphatase HisIE [Myxosarcina sp. GI1]